VFERNDGGVDGFCFNCGVYVENPYGDPKKVEDIPKSDRLSKSKEDIIAEMGEISQLGATDLEDRRLRGATLDHYGIKIGYSEQDGKTPTFAFFPYTKAGKIVKYKVKILQTGRTWSVGLDNEVDLFGWEQAKASGAKRLIIVEGEFDAPAMHKILEIYTKDSFKSYTPAVCSIPNGAGNAKRDLSRLLPEIRKHFKEISIAFDQDEPGRNATAEVCKICPEATVINLPDKDANDCLLNGMGKAAHKAIVFNADKPKNTRLVWGNELHEAGMVAAEWGLSWPWPTMTRKTRGFRFGETVYIAAGEKMGKSELVSAIGAHCIVEHGLSIMLAKPEEANVKTYKMLNSKVVGKFFHDPSKDFDKEAYERGGDVIKDKVCMLNLYQNLTWDVLKNDIHAAVSQGVKAVFIDPITNLTNGMASSDINTTLQGIAQQLAALALDLDIVIFIFCHLNKPPKGSTPWDRGGIITTDYLAGSSAMARSCNYVLGLQGNKDPTTSVKERNSRELVILADREFGESGTCNLYWDQNTGLFGEV
jgi:twinkle protein